VNLKTQVKLQLTFGENLDL